MIYTEYQIETTPLFANVMEEINALHEELMQPEPPLSATTENRSYDRLYGRFFTDDTVGDWNGQEEEVAMSAQSQLETVLNGINRGRYVLYERGSDIWEEFEEEAATIVNDDLDYDVYDRMRSNPTMVGYVDRP